MSGCIFGSKKLLSCEKVRAAFEAYDSEEYGSVDELKSDVENDRALLAGMYIDLKDDSIKKCLTTDKIGDIFGDDQNELLKNMYSKMIEEAVLLIQVENTSAGGSLKMAVLGMDFDDNKDAERYYNAYVKHLKKNYDETDSDMVSGMEFCTATTYTGKKAVCQRVYRYRDSVLVVAGYERGDNGITAKMQAVCDLIGVESPDISGYDCTSTTNAGGRFDLAMEHYDPQLIDPKEFNTKSEEVGTGSYYTETNDIGTVREMLSGSPIKTNQVDNFRGLVNRTRNSVTGIALYEIKTRNNEDAVEIFDTASKELKDENSKEMSGLAEGEEDNINYCYFDVSMFVSQSVYAVYREGDTVYLIAAIGSKQTEARQCFEELTDVMGLPR